MRFPYFFFFLLLNFLFISDAKSQIISIGTEEDVSIETKHPYATSNSGLKHIAFEQDFYSADASYIKIHFRNFHLAKGDYVSISSSESGQEIIYKGKGKSILNGTESISDFWSLSIFSNRATVKLHSTSEASAYGFEIDKVAYGFPEAKIQNIINEAVCGNDDKEDIACYTGTAMFDKAKAVCRLVIGGSGLCTAWLLGTEGHIMTNNHCVSTQNGANNVEFQFNYQTIDCNGNTNASTDQVAQSATLLCTDGDLDYTLLQLPVNPTATYGFLSMRSSGPVVGERIYIPQHPGGSRKKISVLDDRSNSGFAEIININGGVNGTRVEYYSDTEGGSSGSPVISYDDHLVVSLHNTGGCLNGSNRVDAIINHMGSCLPNGAVDNPGGLVLADFEVNTLKSCDGNIQLNNLSFNDISSLWYFGDGNSSTQSSPNHFYAASGDYTIQLVVEDSTGMKDTAFQQISVALVNEPVVTHDSICGTGIGELFANGNGNLLFWYDVASGGNPIQQGNLFTTAQISSSTTYYVELEENTPVLKLGPVDNSIGNGQLFTANDSWGCYFDVEKPLTLNSVKVYAGNAGNRLIELLQNGSLVDSRTINIPSGESRINLDFDINPGSRYLLKVSGGTIDLYRNSSGGNYPYNIQGLISITGNNTTSGTGDNYYYYFYDWELREIPCRSNRVPVTVYVNTPISVSATTTDAHCLGGASGAIDVRISPNNPNVTYNWSNGANTQDLSNVEAGTYTLSVLSGTCETVQSFSVGANGQAGQLSLVAQDESCIGAEDGSINLNISNGQLNPNILWSNGATSQNLSNLAPGSYSVTVGAGLGCSSSASVNILAGAISPSLAATLEDITCYALNDGRIQLQLSDTISPVNIIWSTGDSLTQLNDLAAGNYALTVQNGNACASSANFTISEPDSLSLTIGIDTSQSNSCKARAWANISGGTGNYSFQWNDDLLQTSDTAFGLCPRDYTLRVRDVNACEIMTKFIVDSSFVKQVLNTTLKETELVSEINFYPIPAQDYLRIEFSEALLNKEVQIRLYNILGQKFFQKNFLNINQVEELDLSHSLPGTYVIEIQIAEEMLWKKVLVL